MERRPDLNEPRLDDTLVLELRTSVAQRLCRALIRTCEKCLQRDMKLLRNEWQSQVVTPQLWVTELDIESLRARISLVALIGFLR